jgi:hypothetical protein
MPAPTIGRAVHYTLTQADADIINRRRAGRATRDRVDVQTLGNHAAEGEVCAATVVRTFGGPAANLQVHLDGMDAYWATSRTEGTEPGTWAWPPRT